MPFPWSCHPPDFLHSGANIEVRPWTSAPLFGKALTRITSSMGMMAVTPVIYKIVPETLWQEAIQSGVFNGAAIDLTDGFIHLSTASQAKETAARYFAGQNGLLLVAIDAAALGEKLVFETSR